MKKSVPDGQNKKRLSLRVCALLAVGAAVAAAVVFVGCDDSGINNGPSGKVGAFLDNRYPQTGKIAGPTLHDSRDGKSYRTVKIGRLTWMAENLNFAITATSTDSSWCYGSGSDSCVKYGRLYDWNAAMKACPSGWNLPDTAEWRILVNYAGGWEIAGKKLKSKTGWGDHNDEIGNGTDEFGFSALPGGGRNYGDGSFYDVGRYGDWWSATEYGSGFAYGWLMDGNYDLVYEYSNSKSNGHSVRCVAQD
ncbi:MAG: fibrobacter succinogenes major paralogous domain-containing protein [Chitinispirillales bacterium]|nr:fibrobacter succinogenes major paralogous domain-containing protein [Chitinispirillales bacterium]